MRSVLARAGGHANLNSGGPRVDGHDLVTPHQKLRTHGLIVQDLPLGHLLGGLRSR